MNETKLTKQTYRIRNRAQYNTALIQRGSFTLWLDEAMIKRWYNTEKSGRRGASNTYTDTEGRLPIAAACHAGVPGIVAGPGASPTHDSTLQHLLP